MTERDAFPCRWQIVNPETGRVSRSPAHLTRDGDRTLCGEPIPPGYWRADASECTRYPCGECGAHGVGS